MKSVPSVTHTLEDDDPTYLNHEDLKEIYCSNLSKIINNFQDLSILFYIPWPFPPSLGGSRQHKRTMKTMGVLLRSSSK